MNQVIEQTTQQQTYRKQGQLFIFIFGILPAINTVKIIQQSTNHHHSIVASDLFWPVCFLIYLLAALNFFVGRTSFEVKGNQLIMRNKTLLYHRCIVYKLTEMVQVEVENLKLKNPLLPNFEITSKQVITFFYGDKEIMLGEDLRGFNAQQLLQSIHANLQSN